MAIYRLGHAVDLLADGNGWRPANLGRGYYCENPGEYMYSPNLKLPHVVCTERNRHQ